MDWVDWQKSLVWVPLSQCWGLPGRRKEVLVGPQTPDAGVGVSSKTKVNWTTEVLSNLSCGKVSMDCECLKSN